MRHDEEAVVSSREASKRYDDAVVEKQLGNENFGADHINVALSHYKKVCEAMQRWCAMWLGILVHIFIYVINRPKTLCRFSLLLQRWHRR